MNELNFENATETEPKREPPRSTRPPIDPLLLTVPETADLLRTSVKAVYAMAERGQLAGVTRIGRRLLFRRDVLLEWVCQKSAPSQKEKR